MSGDSSGEELNAQSAEDMVTNDVEFDGGASASNDVAIDGGGATVVFQPGASWLFDEPQPQNELPTLPEYIRHIDDDDFDEDEEYDEDFDEDYDDDLDDFLYEDCYDGLGFDDFDLDNVVLLQSQMFERFGGVETRSEESLKMVVDRVQRLNQEELRNYERYKKIMLKLAQDQKDGLFCDVTLEVDGKNFAVHKNVLKASSSYFEAMFTGAFNEKEEKHIKIGSVSKDVFQYVLDFAYGTAVKLKLDNLENVYMAAQMFCMDDLIEECKKQLEKEWGSVQFDCKEPEIPLKDITKFFDLGELMEMSDFCDNVIGCLKKQLQKRPDDLKALFQMSPNLLLSLLKCSSKYSAKKETDKTKFLLEWFEQNPEERLHCLKDMLGMLTLKLVERKVYEEFKNGIEKLVKVHFKAEDADYVKKHFQKVQDELDNAKSPFTVEVLVFHQDHVLKSCQILYYSENSSGNGSWMTHYFKISNEIKQCVFVEYNNHLVLLSRDSLYVFNVRKPEKVLHPKNALALKRFNDGFVACAQRTQIIIAGVCPFNKRTGVTLTVNALQYWKAKPTIIPLFYLKIDPITKQPSSIMVIDESFYVVVRDKNPHATKGLLLVNQNKIQQTYPFDSFPRSMLKNNLVCGNRMMLHYEENKTVFLFDHYNSIFSGISIKIDDENLRRRPVCKTRISEEVEHKGQDWIGTVRGTFLGSCLFKKSRVLLVGQFEHLVLFNMESLEKFEFLKILPKFPEIVMDIPFESSAFFLRANVPRD